ncbi:MAG: hypothetical protein A2340_01780 [Lentisphaerae bacterium RIFOXYB12_FULL_60_10]|nr:MAG: hypothetical protein A2340_01780 [Lentisphaerae bacterium RIFOXYB12_FULL_60_10]
MEDSMHPWQLARATVLPGGVTSRHQFWLTDSLPAGARNIHRVYPPVTRLGVFLQGDATGEGGCSVSSFCSSIIALESGGYRLYYTAYSRGFGAMWIAVAESNDGLTWERRMLGQHRHDGNDTNRLVFDDFDAKQDFVGQPQVLRLPDGSWRMYFWHHANGYRYTLAHSHDGLRWRIDRPARWTFIDSGMNGKARLENGWEPDGSLPAAESAELWRLKALRTNDASYVYFNDALNRFEYYAQWMVPAHPDRRVEVDNCSQVHRYIQRRLSEDGIVWSVPELVIMPDAQDSWDLQFYHLAVQWHEDWMVGSLGHYRVEGDQQTQDLELVFSRDGKSWHRPLRGGFIPRPARNSGARDREGIYPPNAWIDEGDTWLCLYTGTPVRHREALSKDPAHTTAIMGARWRKQRLIGLAAGKVPGGFLSDVFCPQGDTIRIEADVRGWLRAELCDVFGRKLPGFHLMDSLSVEASGGPETVLRWKDRPTTPFRYDMVRVRFEFSDAELYSLSF